MVWSPHENLVLIWCCRYDRPPLVLKGWAKGNVAVLGDAAHPMMPNLGQGGCQAVEDSYRLAQVGRERRPWASHDWFRGSGSDRVLLVVAVLAVHRS